MQTYTHLYVTDIKSRFAICPYQINVMRTCFGALKLLKYCTVFSYLTEIKDESIDRAFVIAHFGQKCLFFFKTDNHELISYQIRHISCAHKTNNAAAQPVGLKSDATAGPVRVQAILLASPVILFKLR